MTRGDYIDKYGEKEGLRRWKKNEYNKRWYQEHPECNKRYYQAHREQRLESVKRRYQAHREEVLEYHKQYHQEHRKELLENMRRRYQETPYGRAQYLVNGYRKNDRLCNRGECTLTAKWMVDNIFSKRCLYCGESDWKLLGTDRINNNKPHTPENVVCCCGKCNNKRNKMEFLKFAYSMGAKDSDSLIIKY